MDKINENIIKGKIRIGKVLFPKNGQKSDNNYKVISVYPINITEGAIVKNGYGNFVIKGNSPDVFEGETFEVVLRESEPNEHGRQYNIMYIGNPIDFEDKESQKIFLSKILSENQFNSLYSTLEDPFQVIVNEDIASLTKCNGIGSKTAIKLIERYKENIDYSKAYVELDRYGLTSNMVDKLIETYGSPDLAIQKIKENPYLLAYEVDGVGFKKSDEIALKAGVSRLSPFRTKAFIMSYLKECAYNGHSYIHPSELFKSLVEVLEVGIDEVSEIIKSSLNEMYDKKIVWYNEDRSMLSLESVYTLEKNISEELLRLLNCKNKFEYGEWKEVIENTQKNQGWNFTEQQIKGIKKVLENQVVIVTGSAGTGKSSIVTGMIDVLNKKYGYSFAQCALSGRAGARLAEVTKEDGYTIHRLLEFKPNMGFIYNKHNKLHHDIVIVDEISMVGADLFYKLIQSIEDGSKLIVMGDINQLESIGMGNIAKDMIDSGVIPVVNLTQIHRQAKKSAIITESTKIRDGEQIIKSTFKGMETRGKLQDLTLDIYSDKSETQGKLIEHFKECIGRVNSIMDLQVIVPMKNRGDSCTFILNNKLQNICNPHSKEKKEIKINVSKDKFYMLRDGDKVMNVRNNYKTVNLKGDITYIFNGDTGIITEIDENNKTMIIEFERTGDVIIPFRSWKHIELAYASTVHKQQGSQMKIAVIGIDYSSYVMLSKELIYTALTRASEHCILCGENQALRYATETSKVISKRTFLKDFLNKKPHSNQ